LVYINEMNLDRDHLKTFAAGLLSGALVIAFVWAGQSLNRITNPSILAIPSKELAKIEKETLTCKPVVVYRDKAKKALGLHETIKADPEKHVVASTQVKASERPTTVSAVYDSGTGAFDMFTRIDPYPWFGADKKWLVGGFYGVSDDSEGAVGELLGMYDLFQIKALHIGPMGHIDTNGRRFLGAGFWFSGR
jgi:hypothetical protein